MANIDGWQATSSAKSTIVPVEGTDDLNVYLKVDEDTVKGARFPFKEMRAQFVDLSSGIAEIMAPQYETFTAIGRHEHILSYAGGSNRSVNLRFIFHANAQADLRTIRERAKWLEALKYPIVGFNGITYPPPAVYLYIGSLLTMRCVVTASELRWLPPFDPGTLYPHGADVNLVFTNVDKYRFAGFNASPFVATRSDQLVTDSETGYTYTESNRDF